MGNHSKQIEVRILNKSFQVTCPEGAEDQLLDAAQFLDHKMQEIRGMGRVIGIERIALMAALNIAHELLSYRSQKEHYVQSVSAHIERLQNKIDEALINHQTELE